MLHLVCGPPAAGKTTYARTLAASLGAAVFDSDQVAEKLVRAGLILAGLDPNDRDSPAYKTAYRDTVYETLYDLAAANLSNVPVVIAGPFTRECADAGWPQTLQHRFGELPEIHFIWCPSDVRLQRIIARGEARDRPKIESWESYVIACREEPPAFPHHLVVTGP